MGVISGHIVLLALFSVRFLAKSKRAGSLWPFGSTKRYLKEAPRRTPSSRHIQYFCGLEAFSISAPCASLELVHFRHRIGEKGVELILKESIRINLALEDRKKEEEDRKNRKNGRGRKSDKDQTAFIDSSVQEKNVTFSATLRRRGRGRNNCTSILKV